MHPEAERLARGFISDFWSSNHDLRWQQLEHERSLWLDPDTVLVGKIDAIGKTDNGELFFADWKTASKNKARYIESEKSRWRMSPQALTYGVLLGHTTRRFTVRWAFKTDPVTTAFEWFSYERSELEWWHGELLSIADQIRELRRRDNSSEVNPLIVSNWPTNISNCTRYGEKYACPFRDEGCWKLNFNHVPADMTPRTESHLAIEPRVKEEYALNVVAPKEEGKSWPPYDPKLVVLDASRVGDWLTCNEYYRRIWEGQGLHEDSEDLTIGADFHTLIEAHLTQVKGEQDVATQGN